jgi:hypothetical protein
VVFIFFFKKEAFDEEEVFVVFLEAVVALLKMEVVAFVRAHRACLNMVTWCCCCCSRYDDGARRYAFSIHFSFISIFRVSENFSPENFEKSKKNNTRART